MPTTTYTPLATYTLTGTDGEIVFSNIPNTYRDIVAVVSGYAGSFVAMYARFNGDATAANYPRVGLYGGSGGYGSFASTEPGCQASITTVGTIWVLNIMDYAQTNKHKMILGRMSHDSEVNAQGYRWKNTNAITSISFVSSGASFQSGTIFSLWGISA